MTRVFLASSPADLLLLAAGLDAGLFGDVFDDSAERRLLLASNDAAEPEVVPGIDETAALAGLRARFDDVVVWNDVIAPLHPVAWQPPAAELPLLSRLIIDTLGLGDGVSELVVPVGGDGPAPAVAQLLRDAPITGYVADLAGYGPARRALSAGRVERLIYRDVVPGVVPPSLLDYDVAATPLPPEAVQKVVGELPEPGEAAGAPVILGAAPVERDAPPGGGAAPASVGTTAIGGTDPACRMVRALAARGERRVVFRPHPAAVWSPLTASTALHDEAAALGVHLTVADDGLPHEAWFAAARPSLVVSSDGSALAVAGDHGCDVATMDAGLALDRLTPYESSARIVATVVAATVPELAADGTLTPPPPVDLPALIAAVAYCMQPNRLPGLRENAVAYLAEHGSGRYFKKKRVSALSLLPEPAPPPETVRSRRPRWFGR